MGFGVVYFIHKAKLLIASITLSSQPEVAHIIHNPKLFIASKALSP